MKELLLSKSNFRKNKGLSIGIGILVAIGAALMAIVMLIMMDFTPNISKEAKKLNTSDSVTILSRDVEGVDDAYIKSLLDEDCTQYELVEGIGLQMDMKYGAGSVSAFVYLDNLDSYKNKTLSQNQILLEDDTIASNYIYLPYQFYTGGGIRVGDDYSITLNSTTYTYTVKGFLHNILEGSYNTGLVACALDDASMNKVKTACPDLKTYLLDIKVKDGVNIRRYDNKFADKYLASHPLATIGSTTKDGAVTARSFIGLIFAISFVATSIILLIVITLMLALSLKNFIKENAKSLGALKAIGYTSKDLRISLLMQFLMVSLIGTAVGIITSYVIMPLLSTKLIAQQGVPYTIGFNPLSIFGTLVIMLGFIAITIMAFTRQIKRIEPIVALRNGVETHNFKKNHVALEKTKLNLNLALSLKNLLVNMKQNIATFIVVLFLMFSCVLGAVMFQNFGVSPKISMLSFETASGVVSCDSQTEKALEKYFEESDKVTNYKFLSNCELVDENYEKLLAFVCGDITKFNNTDVCYKGRLPKYANEIAISGKYSKLYSYKIGDEIELGFGSNKEKYLVTGLVQTTNNSGQECILTLDAMKRLYDISQAGGFYYFDCDCDASEVINDVKVKFAEHITSTMNFKEMMEGSLVVFTAIANMMLIIMISLTVIVLIVVLYMLNKSALYSRRVELGILKALGYKTKDLMMQNAISYMPSLILGTIVSCIVSGYLANPYLTIMMSSFGIMKASFDIPALLIGGIGLFTIIISFVISMILSRRIKKIEPYKLLIGE